MAEQSKLEHYVEEYDAQREGMTLVSGWQVWARVTTPSGRTFPAIPIALCSDKDDAEEIALLLAVKYGHR